MADVDMTDAPSAAASAVAKKDRKGGDVDSKNDGKKRFEVKKVRKTKVQTKLRVYTNL